jgi:hypothetical protein
MSSLLFCIVNFIPDRAVGNSMGFQRLLLRKKFLQRDSLGPSVSGSLHYAVISVRYRLVGIDAHCN